MKIVLGSQNSSLITKIKFKSQQINLFLNGQNLKLTKRLFTKSSEKPY